MRTGGADHLGPWVGADDLQGPHFAEGLGGDGIIPVPLEVHEEDVLPRATQVWA